MSDNLESFSEEQQRQQLERENAVEQFRMVELQVYNWGTFSGLHRIPISAKGHLLDGQLRLRKVHPLDAITSLLVPPKWVDFNAAAREGEKGRKDRSYISYLRGAWSAQRDESTGEHSTQYLRRSSTWSALVLNFQTAKGQSMSLGLLLWVKGTQQQHRCS